MISKYISWNESRGHNNQNDSSYALIGPLDLKDIEEKTFNSKVHLHESDPDHTWL